MANLEVKDANAASKFIKATGAGTDIDPHVVSHVLDANSGVDIGDVDVLTLPDVTNAGTFAVQEDGAALTALQLIDDAIIADDAAFTPATTKVMMAGFEFDDVTPDVVDEGDAGAARMSARREIYTQIRDAAGNERGVNVNASNELTVIEANSAAILADTANMDTNLGTVAGAVAGAEMQVDIVADGAGLSTAANQTTMITALQLIDDVVFSDDTAFTPASSKVAAIGMMADETTPDSVDEGDIGIPRMTLTRKAYAVISDPTAEQLAGVDASGHLQVDIAADSVGIGGGTQYTEDEPAAANPVGTQPVMVRQDTPATLVSLDGDVVAQRATNYGAAYCQILDSSGNFIDTFGGSGGTAMVDDAVFTPATTQGTPAFAMFDDVTPDSVDEGDAGIIRMSANRNLYSTIRDAAGNERGANVDASNQLLVAEANSTAILADTANMDTNLGTIAGAVAGAEMQVDIVSDGAGLATAANQSTMITALQLIDNIVTTEDTPSANGDSGVVIFARRTATPADTSGLDGDYEALQLDNGRLWTSATIDAALPAGTNAIGKLAANSGVDIGDVDVTSITGVTFSNAAMQITGDEAADDADAGNPVKVGGVAVDMDDTAPPTRIDTEGDRVNLAMDFDGVPFVHPHGPQVWSYHADGSTALTDATVHAAPGAGLSLYVTDIVFSSGAATAINIFFEEATTKVLGPYYLEAVAGRGLHISFKTPKKITANTALTVTTSAAIAHSVDVTGFTAQG